MFVDPEDDDFITHSAGLGRLFIVIIIAAATTAIVQRAYIIIITMILFGLGELSSQQGQTNKVWSHSNSNTQQDAGIETFND